MRVGELAKRTACEMETIRLYEKAGMLAALVRSKSSYCQYQPPHVERLQFIRHCRAFRMAWHRLECYRSFAPTRRGTAEPLTPC